MKKLNQFSTFNSLYLLVFKHINGDAHVPRLFGTRIHVSVVLWQQIDVVKNEAIEIRYFQRFLESHVHQHGSVECAATFLFDYEYRVVQLLSFQKGMHVLQEEQQVFAATPERYY